MYDGTTRDQLPSLVHDADGDKLRKSVSSGLEPLTMSVCHT